MSMDLSAFKTIMEAHREELGPVVPFHPGKDKLLLLDLTEKNKALTEDIINDTQKFNDHIHHLLENAKARYGIGGYTEHRTLYSRSAVFDGAGKNEEPRRLHLGTDIWGKPYTQVMAPLNSIVHSFAFNNNHGDYGATLILTHQLEGKSFYTLYGHLSLNSIKNLQAGERIEKGEVVGEFGIPVENGHWPPHLHFQIIFDLQGKEGDYPGVCKYSEREVWLANCPDPDLILQLDRYTSQL